MKMQECTAKVYEVIVKGKKYMAKAHGNTKLEGNVVYKVEEQVNSFVNGKRSLSWKNQEKGLILSVNFTR